MWTRAARHALPPLETNLFLEKPYATWAGSVCGLQVWLWAWAGRGGSLSYCRSPRLSMGDNQGTVTINNKPPPPRPRCLETVSVTNICTIVSAPPGVARIYRSAETMMIPHTRATSNLPNPTKLRSPCRVPHTAALT